MSGLTVRVREAGPDDWEALKKIRLEALFDTPEAFGSTFEVSRTWSDDQWRQMVQNRPNFLAELDGEVVGMVAGGRSERLPGTGWMYGMFVTPNQRGTGTAEMLVDAVSDWARAQGFRELYLHVGDSVPRARAFYEKVGFRPSGDSMTMDRDPQITLITMVRELD